MTIMTIMIIKNVYTLFLAKSIPCKIVSKLLYNNLPFILVNMLHVWHNYVYLLS